MVKCGQSCFLGAKDCKRRRDCACKCGPLQAVNPNLFNGCEKACNARSNADRPKDHRDYMCNHVGADILFSYYGIVDCGYTIADTSQYCLVNPAAARCTPGTKEYCALHPEEVECQAINEDQDSYIPKVVATIALLIIGIALFFLSKN